jgi:hypothetical protein
MLDAGLPFLAIALRQELCRVSFIETMMMIYEMCVYKRINLSKLLLKASANAQIAFVPEDPLVRWSAWQS